MKRKLFALTLAAALLLSGCSGSTPATTEKSTELSKQYDYYTKSVSNIQKYMEVDPEQADEIFLVMTDCGVSSEINHISSRKDNTFATWSSGTEYTVTLENGTVSTVYLDKDQFYPENIPHNDLMDSGLIVKDVKNGTGDTVIGQYAYISVTDSQLDKMTPEHLKEFAEKMVDGASYNWISIKTPSGKGICFAGCSIIAPAYGELDKDGSVHKLIGTWVLGTDENYTYSE